MICNADYQAKYKKINFIQKFDDETLIIERDKNIFQLPSCRSSKKFLIKCRVHLTFEDKSKVQLESEFYGGKTCLGE